MPATAKKKSHPAAKKTTTAKAKHVAAKPAEHVEPKAAAKVEHKVPAAPARAEAAATALRFAEDWSVNASGPITAGSKLAIHYSLERARAHGGRAGAKGSWGVTAFAMFVPGGESAEVTVVRVTPSEAKVTPAELPVPHGAQEVRVWFRNWTEGDEATEVWDSNFGDNYRFPVTA
jgi:hypothetical protein